MSATFPYHAAADGRGYRVASAAGISRGETTAKIGGSFSFTGVISELVAAGWRGVWGVPQGCFVVHESEPWPAIFDVSE